MEQILTKKGKIHFLAIKTPMKNVKDPSKAPQYSIAVELDVNDEAVKLINKLSPKKVDTLKNMTAIAAGTQDRNKRVINFSSQFAPKPELVLDGDGNVLAAPFFDSRVDTGEAEVLFSVNTVGDRSFINLQGVKLHNLNITPKAGGITKGQELLKSSATLEAELRDVLGK